MHGVEHHTASSDKATLECVKQCAARLTCGSHWSPLQNLME